MKKFEVFLSPVAEKKLTLLLDYLIDEWGVQSKEKFLSKFVSSINQISIHPKSCIESSCKKGLYKCAVTKQTSFYYRILKKEIEIITIFDNRQDQLKIFNEMKKRFS